MNNKTNITVLCKKLSISRPTLYRYIHQGKIKATRHPITGRIYITENEIHKLLEKFDPKLEEPVFREKEKC